jgi:hypothetical protein
MGLYGTTATALSGLFSGGVSTATQAGDMTPEVKQQLLERRWSYMNRRVKKPLIRLWDKEFRFISALENVDSWSWEELANDDGEAKVTFAGGAGNNAWIRDVVTHQTKIGEDLHITFDPDPDKPHDWKNRWGGKVLIIEDVEQISEVAETTLHCISNRRHLRGILLGANPIFPMEIQIPKMFLWGGPTAFTCASATFINLFRLQTLNGFYPIPRNIFAPDTWLNEVSPLNWPIQVMPINPIFDQSRWCTIGARWKDAQTVFAPVMKDAGVICRAYTWLPGDPPPYTVFGDALAELLTPTRACIILSFEDKSGYSGPTGTAIDGAINLFASTLDDLITETLFPLDSITGGDTVTAYNGHQIIFNGDEAAPFFRKLLLVAPTVPPFVFRDIGYGNIVKKTLTIHKQQGTDIVVGGKSPGWVNMAITFMIRWGLAQLAQVIDMGPFGATNVPGSLGLDNLYQGQLDDVFLAFQRYINPLRSADAGSYAFREYFEQGAGSAYTINGIQSLAEGDFKMRAYAAMKFDVGIAPIVWGEDFVLGDRLMAEIRGVYYVDQILAVRAQGSRTESGRPMVSFGDDTRNEDPVARAFRSISNVGNFAEMLATGGDIF